MKAQAIKDLHYSWHLEILLNCTHLKARERIFKYHSQLKSLIVFTFMNTYTNTDVSFVSAPHLHEANQTYALSLPLSTWLINGNWDFSVKAP